MRIHILGICGTFMGGLAQLARAAGHQVSGCDANVYPPMSDQLAAAGIDIIPGYGAEQLSVRPDVWVIGNAISRGNPLLEAVLDSGQPYVSGPAWLADNVLRGRRVLAVAGTHGKTTTASMLAFILERLGREPGFLIGGVPRDFGVSARLGGSDLFVIEGDEYDTAFCDKRSKFVHYRPTVAVLNNLEFDHADIFPDLAAIEWQFHQLMRVIPRRGTVVVNGDAPALRRVIERGCWSALEYFNTPSGWTVDPAGSVCLAGREQGRLVLTQPGRHNQLNGLAAVLAARAAGCDLTRALAALASFSGVKRRLEVRGEVGGVTVIDDFAHHPTAIAATIAAARSAYGPERRILTVFEPRSNTMKLGAMKDRLTDALVGADLVFCWQNADVRWDAAAALRGLEPPARVFTGDLAELVAAVRAAARPGDVILCMSNGGFGGVHGRLLAALAAPAS